MSNTSKSPSSTVIAHPAGQRRDGTAGTRAGNCFAQAARPARKSARSGIREMSRSAAPPHASARPSRSGSNIWRTSRGRPEKNDEPRRADPRPPRAVRLPSRLRRPWRSAPKRRGRRRPSKKGGRFRARPPSTHRPPHPWSRRGRPVARTLAPGHFRAGGGSRPSPDLSRRQKMPPRSRARMPRPVRARPPHATPRPRVANGDLFSLRPCRSARKAPARGWAAVAEPNASASTRPPPTSPQQRPPTQATAPACGPPTDDVHRPSGPPERGSHPWENRSGSEASPLFRPGPAAARQQPTRSGEPATGPVHTGPLQPPYADRSGPEKSKSNCRLTVARAGTIAFSATYCSPARSPSGSATARHQGWRSRNPRTSRILAFE